MAQTIEDVNGRTLLQQFHSLYKKQNQTETDVENLGTKIDQETVDRQTADLNLNAEIDTLREQIESLGVLFTYKGEVATIQDLPLTNNTPGDVYYVESDQSEYIWLEKSGVYQWEQFGPAIDLSAYAKQEDLKQLQNDVNSMNTQVENNASNIVSLTNTKQDKLTAGTNITIDSNNVISASGGLTKVVATDVDSESATNGQVLTANGSGGASWQNASGGKVYEHIIQISSAFDYYIRIYTNSPEILTAQILGALLHKGNYKIPLYITSYAYGNGEIRYYTTLDSGSNAPLRVSYEVYNFTIDNGNIKITLINNNADTYNSIFRDSVREI